MESVKRILLVLSYFAFIGAGTLYLYGIDRGLALLFNMGCLGALCSVLGHKKGRSEIGWFFAGLFGGVLGLAAAIAVKPKGAPLEV